MATKGTFSMDVTCLSGDSVDPTDYGRALDKVKKLLEQGATSGEFDFSYRYSATGSLETARYHVSWKIR